MACWVYNNMALLGVRNLLLDKCLPNRDQKWILWLYYRWLLHLYAYSNPSHSNFFNTYKLLYHILSYKWGDTQSLWIHRIYLSTNPRRHNNLYSTSGGDGTIPNLVWRFNFAANNGNNSMFVLLHNDHTSTIQIALRHGFLAGPRLSRSNFLCRLLFYNESWTSKELLDTVLHISIRTSNRGTLCVLYFSLEVIQPPSLVIAVYSVALLVLISVCSSVICHSSWPQEYVQVWWLSHARQVEWSSLVGISNQLTVRKREALLTTLLNTNLTELKTQ